MRIIIIGAGTIGTNLARSLSEEDHEVYLIERDEEMAQRADEKLDAKVIIGNGADPETLKKASVEQTDLVLAVTNSDETNLFVCSLASFFGAKQRIARLLLMLVRDEQTSECDLFGREDIGAMLGITTETASRTIADYKRQSLLVETRPNHFLLDVPNLQRIGDG